MTRLVYMGSPAEAIAPLSYLCEQGATVVGVVSQPAQVVGRGRQSPRVDPPVAAYAKSMGLQVYQPLRASDPSFLAELSGLAPTVVITCAYGQMLSQAFLEIPTRATINIHPSRLPAYRGATPVSAALLAAATSTAVSILFTVKAMDAGPIICQQDFEIEPHETAGALTQRLFAASGPLVMQALQALADPEFTGTPQAEHLVSRCRKMTKAQGLIDWSQSAQEIYNHFRAYHPWPGTFTELAGKRVVFEAMQPYSQAVGPATAAPGFCCYDAEAAALRLKTADGGGLQVTQLKPAGSRSLSARDFWNGHGDRILASQSGS